MAPDPLSLTQGRAAGAQLSLPGRCHLQGPSCGLPLPLGTPAYSLLAWTPGKDPEPCGMRRLGSGVLSYAGQTAPLVLPSPASHFALVMQSVAAKANEIIHP